MPSDLQQDTARHNGAKSNGPTTEEGKARSSQNAVKHGLTSRTVVLANESQERYEKLLEAYRAEWLPQGQTENDLVTEMANDRWRLRRIWAMETAALDSEMFIHRKGFEASFSVTTPAMRQADAFQSLSLGDDNFLDKLDRYETRYKRGFQRSLKTLIACQQLRGFDPQAQTGPQQAILPNEPASLLERLLLRPAASKSSPRRPSPPRNFAAPRFLDPENSQTPENFHWKTEYSSQAESA